MNPRTAVFFAALLTAASTVTSAKSRRTRSDDGSPLEAVVVQLSQKVDTLTAQLAQQANTFNAQLTEMSTELAALKNKTGSLDKVVAFYAWNSVSPLNAAPHAILIFDHAGTNQGNAYNTLTGVFTAPTSGMYYFQTVIQSGKIGHVRAGIYVDGHIMAEGMSDTGHGYSDQTAVSAITRVNAGQTVYVKNPDSVSYSYFGLLSRPRTTFFGFRINEG